VTAAGRAIADGNPAHLDIVFRRNNHLCLRMDTFIGAPEYGPVEGKVHRIASDLASDRMISRGPETIRISLMNVAVSSLAVTGRIRAPAGQFLPPPLTVAAAAVGDHQPVAAVTKQETSGRNRMGGGKGDSCRRDQLFAQKQRFILPRRDQLQRRQVRDPLLK